MRNLIGQEIHGYKLLLLLGSGSSAHVYLGKHMRNQSYVAIKVLHSQHMHERIEGWNNETRLLSHLSHPYIIRMYASGIHNKQPFRITNWAELGTFRDLFSQCMPLSDVAKYIRQIASALQYLHTRHIVHRDLKPSNLLVEQDGQALLADFELAVDYRDCRSPMGTAAYAAPEQKRGYPCPASDQYALGVIVYQWLCGELPAVDEAKTKSIWPSSILPHAVDAVLQTALAQDPALRFGNVQMFADAFEEVCRASAYLTPAQNIEAFSTDNPGHLT